MNEKTNQKILIVTHKSNTRTYSLSKQHKFKFDYLPFAYMNFTNEGVFTKNLEPVDFGRFNKIIFFPSSQGVFKSSMLKYLKAFYPETRLLNVSNIPACGWNWESKFEQSLAVRSYGLDINMPRTMAINYCSSVEKQYRFALKYFKSFPLVSKPTYGSQGRDVKLIKTKAQLKAIINKAFKLAVNHKEKNMLLLQEFIDREVKYDIRVMMINGKILGGMKRTARAKGEFRSNYSLKGIIEKYEPIETQIIKFCEKFFKHTGLLTPGFDFIKDDNGKIYFIEVTTLPQSKGFNKVHGIEFNRMRLELYYNI